MRVHCVTMNFIFFVWKEDIKGERREKYNSGRWLKILIWSK